jgi:hypothetical protein
MFRDENTLMQYHYQRNAELKTMMDNLNQFTIEEIESCSLPKWMRLALVNSKKRTIENEKYVSLKELVLKSFKESYVEDTKGTIFRWTGVEKFIYFGKTQILIKSQELFFVTQKGIWLDTVFTDKYDPGLNEYVFVKSCTFSEYKSYRQQDLQKRMPNFEHQLPVIGENLPNKSTASYSIYRLP